MQEQILIGIDPGSRALGYGVLKRQKGQLLALEWGVIRPKADDLSGRLGLISVELKAIFERYKPTHVVVEKVFLGKNPDSAFILGHARGVALAMAGLVGATVSEYATRSVKKIVTGQGGAEKEHVKRVVEVLLKIKVEELDATDALAMAITESRKLDEAELMGRQSAVKLGVKL